MSERIKEIRELLTTTPQELEKEVSIIYDKKQYTIRIPKNFAEKIALNPQTDKILFKINIPSNPEEEEKFKNIIVKIVKGILLMMKAFTE